jgi:(p)ppGpp synthase/HD superfamily hydrolase
MAAALHDVIEDTSWTLEELRNAGVPVDVLAAVDVLTHRAGESYDRSVARAAGHPLARLVKLADNADNASEARLSSLSADVAARLRAKYAAARRALLEQS